MTKEELKQKAKDWCKSKNLTPSNVGYFTADYCEQSYIAGATENGIQWHDLRKDPKDLPKPSELFYDVSERVIGVQEVAPRQFMSIECRYNLIEKKWRISQDPYYADVIAWCEEPRFKE